MPKSSPMRSMMTVLCIIISMTSCSERKTIAKSAAMTAEYGKAVQSAPSLEAAQAMGRGVEALGSGMHDLIGPDIPSPLTADQITANPDLANGYAIALAADLREIRARYESLKSWIVKGGAALFATLMGSGGLMLVKNLNSSRAFRQVIAGIQKVRETSPELKAILNAELSAKLDEKSKQIVQKTKKRT